MHPDAPKLLEDVRDAASFIQEVSRDLSFEAYESSRLHRQAVERNFEIIGEALTRLERIDPATAGRAGPLTRIKAFRNILVHVYDTIDHQIVWDVIQRQLPPLLAIVEQLLGELGEG